MSTAPSQPPRRLRPFVTAVLNGLGVVLPPLLTVVLLIWVARTVTFYVLEPMTVGARYVLAWSLADVRTELPESRPGGKPDVFIQDGESFRRLDNGQYIPANVYDQVARAGRLPYPPDGQNIYRRWVELEYLQSVYLTPVLLVIFIAAMYLLGSLFAAGVGSVLVGMFDHTIARVPLVRSVYNSVKQVTQYMLDDRDIEFTRVVAFEYPRPGLWTVAFVTGDGLAEVRELTGEPMLAVLVPVSPMPVTGYTKLVARREVLDLNMTFDQACQFIISFGVVAPSAVLKPYVVAERLES